MTKDEALKLALEALKPLVRRAAPWGEQDWLNGCKAITAIKEALAQPEQYDQTALELCNSCGWKTLIPNDVCLNCERAQPEPMAVYGYCPQCGAKGAMRERRPNGNDKCANGHTYPSSTSTPPQRKPLTEDEEFSNGFALALHDAVLIRIGKDDEPTRQAIARIDKLVSKYKDEAAHGIKEDK
ncbi:hypothetical protein UFOVP183_31 [uncultured Caudovirales phage]|uniref:Uncharacterized protein n=1 Tax=uncultured Caudovirales phage TaxID=2100421 RepID=A0A6J7WJZ4_9CAUD|nr:hypothetical protein UFOVP183_31 [uncultured Caudovirales phage]